MAHQYARMLHARHPKWIHAVETTYDQADAAIAGQPPAAPGGGDVVLIQIKGKGTLVDGFDSEDPFDPPPHRGRFFHLVVDRTTCFEAIHGIGPKGVRLRPLGQVTTIE